MTNKIEMMKKAVMDAAEAVSEASEHPTVQVMDKITVGLGMATAATLVVGAVTRNQKIITVAMAGAAATVMASAVQATAVTVIATKSVVSTIKDAREMMRVAEEIK